MASSTGPSLTSFAEDDGASMNLPIPVCAGITAPPSTPMASLPPRHPAREFIFGPPPLDSKSAEDLETILPCQSSNIASPPSKEDLDALAHFLSQQSLHSTPNLSPTLQRKRRSSSMPISAAIRPDNDSTSVEEEVGVVNGRNDISSGEVVQTYSYSDEFCKESRRGIREACQEVGAFYISVQEQDAEAALGMLRAGGHGADDESLVEGGLIPLSHLLTSQRHQQDVLLLDPLAFDAAVDTNFRDTMTKFARILFRISKDLLRLLLEDLSMETQANIRGHSLKPLLYIHDNGKKELNLGDDMVLSITHDIDSHEGNKKALFLASMGTQLQTWSQGRYKAPILKSLCKNGSGEVCIQFALIQHY